MTFNKVKLFSNLATTNVSEILNPTLNQNILNTQTGIAPSLGLITLTGLIPKGNYIRLRGQVDLNSSITYLDGTEYHK